MLLLVALLAWSVPRPAQAAAPQVAIVELLFWGDVAPGLHSDLLVRLRQGLMASGMPTVVDGNLEQSLGRGEGPCGEATCWQGRGQALGVPYALGVEVSGEDRTYVISLWLGDNATGAVLVRDEVTCELCGFRGLLEKMELVASSLAAKVQEAIAALGHLKVQSVPGGARVGLDGQAQGETPQTLKLLPGSYALSVVHPGYRPEKRTVRMTAGAREDLWLVLEPTIAPPAWPRQAGWIAVASGLAAIIAGAVLVAVDGPTCGGGDVLIQCPDYRATATAGWTLTGLGIATLISGSYVLYTF